MCKPGAHCSPFHDSQEIYLPKGTYPHAVTAARNGTLLAVSTYYVGELEQHIRSQLSCRVVAGATAARAVAVSVGHCASAGWATVSQGMPCCTCDCPHLLRAKSHHPCR